MSVEGAGTTDEALRAWLDTHVAEVRSVTMRAAVRTQTIAKQRCPVDEGRLRASIAFRFSEDGTEAEVYTDVNYAAYVEYGTRPHMPPVSAVAGWALRHGADPWAVAYGIAKHGTREHPFMRPAWDDVRGSYYRELAEAMFS